ncbi:hypothetical protein PCCS19_41890 [Paenibacillus sp. CCS19]|nr:hypothetical protein PCCS19_41890 [Paenibacillus cellulosilyticus]
MRADEHRLQRSEARREGYDKWLEVELDTIVTPSLLAEKLNITRVHVQRLLRGIHEKGYIKASNETGKQRIRGDLPTFQPERKYW